MSTVARGQKPSKPRKPQRQVPLQRAGTVVDTYVTDLQRGFLADRASAVALLAQLRRGAGKTPDQVPELWGLTGTEALYAQGPMEEGQAAQAETAVHLAVTLYALHQQSQRSRRMHVPGIEIGAAVRQLMPPTGIDEAVRKRFVRVGTAATPGLLAVRLREVVTLLRREEIPLDYALLADRLYQAQQPGGMRQVRQIWGRSFHAYRFRQPDDVGKNTPPDTQPVQDPASDQSSA